MSPNGLDSFGGMHVHKHIILRVPGSRRRPEEFVQAHNEIVNAVGQVAVGKLGRRPLRHRVEEVLATGSSMLNLVFRIGGNYSCYAAKLDSVHFDAVINLPHPSYYNDLESKPTTWFLVGEVFQVSSLDRLVMEKDKRPVLTVLRECGTALLFAQESEDTDIGTLGKGTD